MTNYNTTELEDGRSGKWVGNDFWVTHSKTGKPLVKAYRLPNEGDIQFKLSNDILKLSTALAVMKKRGLELNTFVLSDLELLQRRIREWING